MTTFLISKKASDKRGLLNKLSEMEKRIEGIAKAGPKDSHEKYIADETTKLNAGDKLSSDVVDELRKHDPSKLLKILADNGIIFSPEDFVEYLFGDKLKDTSVVSKMKDRLPSGFSELAEDDEAGDNLVNNEKYDPADFGGMPKELKSIISNLFEDQSLFDHPAHKRIMKITIIGRSPRKLRASVAKDELEKDAAADELAQQYLAYKLAALRYMEECGRLDNQTLLNALVQNR
jgi:hypothetical protein